jgi:hypothetical protein
MIRALPAPVRTAAAVSIAAAHTAAACLSGSARRSLARAADTAYVRGMTQAAAVCIVLLLCCAIMCLILLPGKDGEGRCG